MKKMICMSILIAVILAGCTPSTSNPESKSAHSPDTDAFTADVSVNLLAEMDATGIEYIEPTNDSVYIIGVKRDKSLSQRELIYAVYDLNTNSIDVINRDFSPIDGAHNMSVCHDESGEISLFTGQKILTIKDSDLVSELEIPEKYKREAFLNMKHDQMVYVDESDLCLYLHAVDDAESQPKRIYESLHTMDEGGNEHILFPYNPRFNYQGDKVLFGIAEDDTSSYQKVMIYDIPSGEITKTDDLTIHADFLDFLWYEDGFITLEITDYLGKSLPTGGTIFTQYDAEGKLLKRTALDCMSLSCQRKFYSDTGLYAFGYRKNDEGGLAIYDIDKNDIYSVHQSDDHIVSPTVSPDGEKVLWVENGTLHINEISSLTHSQSIGISDAEMISGRQPSQPGVHLQPDASPAIIAEHINNDSEQSGSSALQAPGEVGNGTTNSQSVPPEASAPSKNTTEDPQEYQVMEKNAEALASYLRENLSPEDYGGIYLEKWGLGDDGGIFLYVWTLDASALDSALASYTGEYFPVERLQARCSMAQLLQLNEALDSIELSEGAYIGHTLYETGNLVTTTVSEFDFDRISSEIKQIANNLKIPDECVIINKPLSENPVT